MGKTESRLKLIWSHCRGIAFYAILNKEKTLPFQRVPYFITYYFVYTNILVPIGKLVGAGSDEPLPFIFTKSILETPFK